MSEPDELYTLRAQFWLGHYQMALDEAKAIMRRPMSPALKEEREEYVQRCYIAMGQYDKVIATDTPALQALALQAKFMSVAGNEGAQQEIVQQLQSMLGDGVSPSVQLTAAHVFLAAGDMKKEALQCVQGGSNIEQVACTLQIYLQLDRLDLAQSQCLQKLRQMDEDSVLTQVGSVHCALAQGKSGSQDALHTLNQLSEQYGPSILLLNLMACACLQSGQYAQAEQKLEQARVELGAINDADTLANLIVAYQYQQKPTAELVQALKQQFPNHFLSKGLDIVEGAFAREAVKYQVAS